MTGPNGAPPQVSHVILAPDILDIKYNTSPLDTGDCTCSIVWRCNSRAVSHHFLIRLAGRPQAGDGLRRRRRWPRWRVSALPQTSPANSTIPILHTIFAIARWWMTPSVSWHQCTPALELCFLVAPTAVAVATTRATAAVAAPMEAASEVLSPTSCTSSKPPHRTGCHHSTSWLLWHCS